MLNKRDLTVGSLLSASGQFKVPGESLVGALEETAYGVMAYTENFKEEVVDHTKGGDSQHTELVTEISTKLADVVRGAVETTRVFAAPFCDTVAKAIFEQLSLVNVEKETFGNLNIKHYPAYYPFFDSQLFPAGAKSSSLDFSKFSINNLDNLTINDEELEAGYREFFSGIVNSKHPDIVNVVTDADVRGVNLVKDIFSKDWWMTNFDFDHTTKVISFDKFKPTNVKDVIFAYVILSLLKKQEGVMPGLSGVSLDGYRGLINELWEGLNIYLPVVKQRMSMFSQSGLHITNESKIEVIEKDGFKRLVGEATVYYSKEFFDSCSNNIRSVIVSYIVGGVQEGYKLSPLAFANESEWDSAKNILVEGNRDILANGLEGNIKSIIMDTYTKYLDQHNINVEDLDTNAEITYGAWNIARCITDMDSEFTYDRVVKAVYVSRLAEDLLRKFKYNVASRLMWFVKDNLEKGIEKREAMALAMVSVITELALQDHEGR